MAQQHAVQDGIAAAQRAREGTRPRWHPMLAAVESHPAIWHMVDERGCYGVIRLVRRGPELGYRAETWRERSAAGESGSTSGSDSGSPGSPELIGYYRTLRAACAATHHRYLREHGNPTLPNVPPR